MVLNTEWAQVEVIDLINDGSGLAFGIIGGRSTGVVVKTILPGGVADRDGRLQSGDHILQIGEVNLRGLGSEQVASVLRQCGIHVRMVVARPIESASADYQALASHAPIVPTKILGDPLELDRHLVENGFPGTSAPNVVASSYHHPPSTSPFIYNNSNQTPPTSISDGGNFNIMHHPLCVDVVRNPLPIGEIPVPINNNNSTTIRDQDLPETEQYEVELTKDDLGLGITVAGYVCEREEISGIFVKSISRGSAADHTNKIKINDRIVEVDGVSIVGHTNHQAVELLRNSGSNVKIKLERYLRGPKYEQLQQAIKANELRPPSPQSPTITSLPKIPLSQVKMSVLSTTIEPESESRTSFDFDSAVLLEGNEDREIVIDCRHQSLQFSISSRDTIYEKWRSKLPSQVEIIIAEMHKETSSGLGISLEGTVDVEGGVEVRPHHYIRNILSDGPVGRNGTLQAGDELLEVNGIQLMGLNHLEVVAILKQLPNFVSLVCARYPISYSRVIDTSQHREAFQARKILAGSLQTLIPTNEVNACNNNNNNNIKIIKAKSETSIGSANSMNSNGSNKSKSLELIAGLPMWSEEAETIELIKGDYGLGFSILDYQDPLNPLETVIVIRSLVPGGVAQQDGRLIPGDRLLSVNDVDVSHASLDEAVQVLKGMQKGPIRISVAKPLTTLEANSRCSQDTEEEEEDQTCLEEDFQECIEEYQECLEVVHICIDEENSSLSSPKKQTNENYCSTNLISTASCDRFPENRNSIANTNIFNKTDSLTQSDKDDYETCIDESFSEDCKAVKYEEIIEDLTPTNSKIDISDEPLLIKSEQCLPDDSKLPHQTQEEIGLKSYDNDDNDGDEFFLVQYPPEEASRHLQHQKSYSDPNILDDPEPSKTPKKLTYRLEEYYNDYEDCIETYRIASATTAEEIKDDLIFSNIVLPFKSRSAPDIMDRSFVTMTYDPGPIVTVRRKSAFVGCHVENNEDDTASRTTMTVIRPDTACHKKEISEMLQKHWGPAHSVKVQREFGASLGISIVGGKVDISKDASSEKILGIFVKNVVPNSPAGRTGQFKTGDRILEVSGIDLSEASHEKAVEAIRNAPNPVEFIVQSLIPWTYEGDSDCFNNTDNDNNCPSPYPSPVSVHAPIKTMDVPQISVSSNDDDRQSEPKISHNLIEINKVNQINDDSCHNSSTLNDRDIIIKDDSYDDSDDDDVDTREMEGRTISSKGQQIDRASAGNLKRSREEIELDPEDEDDFGYTTNKVKKKYASLGHTILMVQLERSKQGLGLSLAGHKDRNCMAVFVCGLNPNGAAYKTGAIQIGDEILEVNGVVLHGRCHLNASAIIKGLSGPIFKVIILRRKTAIDDIAVKPITQFPVSLAEEASEEHFTSTYPNVRTVAVKKGNQSLGIMIIEGKHAEVGQGIFISDIQEGSAAEKAGLEIGEMILAVNKDSLVGSNYDQAASLLKRTEGLVTLVVSNPSKKDNKKADQTSNQLQLVENNKNAAGLKLTPSRPTTPIPEPAADPATCPIVPGKETTVEILTDNRGLGIFFVGGKDTLLPNGIVVVEVYPGGAADKDHRLRPGDQILDVNGNSLKDVSSTTASQALRQTLPKMKLVVFRPERLEYTPLDIDLLKKPGKGLGLSVIARKNGKGVYIADIISGGAADLDGRIMRGDLLVSVNGQSVENCSGEEAGAILKTVNGRVALKLHRYKPTAVAR